jgi:hypothetical protein
MGVLPVCGGHALHWLLANRSIAFLVLATFDSGR